MKADSEGWYLGIGVKGYEKKKKATKAYKLLFIAELVFDRNVIERDLGT